MGFRAKLAAGMLIGLVPAVCDAQSTTTYTYDALGRLTTTTQSGGANNGVQTSTAYDPAGNRTTYQLSGGHDGSSGTSAGADTARPMVIVVPLNGFTVIPIQ